MESVNDPCDYASLSDSSSCDSYGSIEDNICKGCTERRTENFTSDDETDLHNLFDDKVADMNRTWHHHLHVRDASFLFANISNKREKMLNYIKKTKKQQISQN